jgi:CDP-glucose 4,6-dehydratase
MHLAWKMRELDIHGEAFNFSNEIQVTVLELVKKITLLMGKEDITSRVLKSSKNEIHHQYLSAKKARKMLGWKPKYTLDEGLKETIEWYTKFLSEDKR